MGDWEDWDMLTSEAVSGSQSVWAGEEKLATPRIYGGVNSWRWKIGLACSKDGFIHSPKGLSTEIAEISTIVG